MKDDNSDKYIVTYIKPIENLTFNGLPYIMEKEYFLNEKEFKSFMEVCRTNRWKFIKKVVYNTKFIT